MVQTFRLSNWAVLALGLCLISSSASAQLFGPLPAYAADAPNAELAPGYKRPSDAEALAAAKKVMLASLTNPTTAQFGPMTRKKAKNGRGVLVDVICGSANAQNNRGGFNGGAPFVYFVARKEVYYGTKGSSHAIVTKVFCEEPAPKQTR